MHTAGTTGKPCGDLARQAAGYADAAQQAVLTHCSTVNHASHLQGSYLLARPMSKLALTTCPYMPPNQVQGMSKADLISVWKAEWRT